jgi:DNA-binding response OmpR family regulator
MTDFLPQPVVLVIEDQQEILEKVTSALTGAHYTACACTTSEAALATAIETPPQLIISAAHLHGQSGMEICERIRRTPGADAVPVMFLSAGQMPDIIHRHDPLGGSYYLRKPFDSEVLLNLVDQSLRSTTLNTV